jgi:hypothetical protein
MNQRVPRFARVPFERRPARAASIRSAGAPSVADSPSDVQPRSDPRISETTVASRSSGRPAATAACWTSVATAERATPLDSVPPRGAPLRVSGGVTAGAGVAVAGPAAGRLRPASGA